MAERNRRGDDAADDRPDGESIDETPVEDDESVAKGGDATQSTAESSEGKPKAKSDGRVGFFGRIIRFVREVVAELRKVIWPTRKELLTYTAVVVVFIAVMLTIVAGLDFAFAKGVLWVFGNPS
ncbi:preprotein translocase subunit SecE [Micromonospora sp. NBC_01813]|jgi:preprotein translocase subunit SecE|uniref:preprotein translocase subunit SecE n=1 Tax=Micromonospora sp. NBC_01813 TaxID=2975988 RepID=UPI002DDC73AD|nr:preprotein translocase subunit SecE [Micromonospora sp. NBC_01813]WSA08170.1 preprotein translocase subunit SecE [Micromonospora sp. NBC_01813]